MPGAFSLLLAGALVLSGCLIGCDSPAGTGSVPPGGSEDATADGASGGDTVTGQPDAGGSVGAGSADDPAGGDSSAADPAAGDPPAVEAAFGLLGVDPSSGPVEGGFSVVLTGTAFRVGMTVLLGNSPVEDLFVVNDVLAIFTAPPHPPGFVSVVAFPEESETGEPAELIDAFRYEADLLIVEIDPDEGELDGGEQVTVLGTGFEDDVVLFIDGRPALEQHRVDANTVVGIAPPGGAPGPADVEVTAGGLVTEATGLYRYREAPRVDALEPLSGPASGGTTVRLEGGGLDADSDVRFGGAQAKVVAAAEDGTWLEVSSPPGAPGAVVDIDIQTSWGVGAAAAAWSWMAPEADPYLLTCTHAYPAAGASAGGTSVRVACSGLQYGGAVRFGDAEATTTAVSAAGGFVEVVSPAGPAGPVDLTVSHLYGATTLVDGFEWLAPAALQVAQVEPASGPTAGGNEVVISGQGLGADAIVWFGGLPASSALAEEGTLRVVAPPGPPGPVDVRVQQDGLVARLDGGYSYSDGQLHLALVTPHIAAQAGGTWLRVHGDGFDESTRVFFGGEEAEVILVVSTAELHARSPRLAIGLWDGSVVRGDGAEAVLAGALTTYDPRSGYAGTWGGPIDGSLNVTVNATNDGGAIPGAFVVAQPDGNPALSGYTDARGQVTLSEPWLGGPVTVTASAPGYSSYSIAHFNGRNVTINLRLLDPTPGSGGGQGFPLDATLRGKVLGLDKYVKATAGSCDDAPWTGAPDCDDCDPEQGCGAEGYGCVDLLEQGARCLAQCEVAADCAEGYVCAGVDAVARCIPDPGERIARCGVSAQTVFSTDIYTPPTGWVEVGETFELQSTRLGDLAIVCWGGYRTASGAFTPTAMGVRRHVHALSAQVLEGLDVELNHPLREIFRLRLQAPPTWPAGLNTPSVTLSLDLGSDGAIPMTRTLIPRGQDLYLAAHQLSALDGDLYDASYSLYSSISAAGSTGYPVAYNLVQLVTSVVEPRLPVLADDGAWTLETTALRQDLFGLWGTAEDALYAVGAGGLVLRYNGLGWYAQSSQTSETLRAVAGRGASDVWAVGDAGVVRHWDGISWEVVEAPEVDYRAVATAPGQPIWVAGSVRLRAYDDLLGQWSVEGPPWVQGILGLALDPQTGLLAAATSGGAVAVRTTDGVWQLYQAPPGSQAVAPRALRDIAWLPDGRWLAVGDGGLILTGGTDGAAPTVVPTTVADTLTSVTVTDAGRVHAVGDNGVHVAGFFGAATDGAAGVDGAGGDVAGGDETPAGGLWIEEEIPDYRARAEAVFAPPGSTLVRVVGGVAFVLGPYLRFPELASASVGGAGAGVTLSYAWDGGAAAQYSRLIISPEFSASIWTLIVDGDQTEVTLPNLPLLAGLEGLGSGTRRLELMRVLNLNFDIDSYTSREFSIYRRTSWSVNQTSFYAP